MQGMDPRRRGHAKPPTDGDRGPVLEDLVVDPLDLVDDAAVEHPGRFDARARRRLEQVDARAGRLLQPAYAGDLEPQQVAHAVVHHLAFEVGPGEPESRQLVHRQVDPSEVQVLADVSDEVGQLEGHAQVLRRLDEPFADPSIIPTFQLCEFARREIKVALGGDGGDELFAGYDPFKALAVAGWYHALVPARLKGGIRRLAECLPVSDANMSFDFRIKRGLRGASYPSRLWNPVWLGPLEAREISDLFQEPVAVEELYEEAIHAWESTSAVHVVDKTLEFYTRFYLQDDILAKADRASMMVSLEVRSPFLDQDVADFARRIPHEYKYRHGQTKYLLKAALRGVLPDEVLDRPKKGFGIPLTRWLRTWDDVGFARAATLVGNPSWTARTLAEHKAGKRDQRLALWCLLALEHHAEALQ